MSPLFRTSVVFVAWAMVGMGLMAPRAEARPDPATYTWKVTCTVPVLPPQPNDAHFIFSGTGGTIKNAAYIMGPAVGGIVGASNQVDITWPAKMPPGTVFMFTFTTSHPSVAFAGGNWTNDGADIGQIGANDVVVIEDSVPTVSEWGLIAIAGGFLVAGPFVLRRSGLFA